MSTKAIRASIALFTDLAKSHRLGVSAEQGEAIRAALAEVEAIEKAAADLTRLNLGDGVYDVREMEHVLQSPGESWEHPDVKAWGDAAMLLESIASQK